MSKVLVLYCSAHGHIETMADAIAEGPRQGGAEVDVRRVPELVPERVAPQANMKLDQAAPIASSGAATFTSTGMVVVGLPYSFFGLTSSAEIHGGLPYGATTITGVDGSRRPCQMDLAAAHFQGQLVAETAAKLFD